MQTLFKEAFCPDIILFKLQSCDFIFSNSDVIFACSRDVFCSNSTYKLVIISVAYGIAESIMPFMELNLSFGGSDNHQILLYHSIFEQLSNSFNIFLAFSNFECINSISLSFVICLIFSKLSCKDFTFCMTSSLSSLEMSWNTS